MKRTINLLSIGIILIVGVASTGPHLTHPAQSPKDLAVNGARKPVLVVPATASLSPELSARLVPVGQAVVNTNRPPYTNQPQLQPWGFGFVWQATNGRGFSTYLILHNTNSPAGPWTNVVQQVEPDNLWHTNWIQFNPAVKQDFYKLFRY